MLAIALLVAGTSPSRGGSTANAEVVYRLRPDPRMCPSPLCGGYWATRVNATITTCIGGDARAACYVARVDLKSFASGTQARIRAALAESSVLLGGSIMRYPSDAFPKLGSLVARSAWQRVGGGDGRGTVYRVVDTGIRCIRAPCFSFRATVVNDTRTSRLSEVDLEAAGISASAAQRARTLLRNGGILVAGFVRTVSNPGWPESGSRLTATQVWLPA
jgi:hypothetical protein